MLYDNYRAKVQKFANVIKWMAIHRNLLIAIAAALIALLSAFLGVKGKVVDPVTETELGTYVYGETLDYSASAIFGEVYYEYSTDGVNWSTDLPTLPGTNYVRAVSARSFGAKGYGKVHSFVIEKRPISVEIVSDFVTYGDDPSLSCSLSYNDKLYCDKFIYDDITSSYTTVTPDVDSIRIINGDGNDASACYDITVSGKQLYIYSRKITIAADSAEKVYDGTPLVAPTFSLSGSLAFDDSAFVEVEGSATNYGDAGKNVIGAVSITSADGKDVTGRYDITKLSGQLTIEKKPITVYTGDLNAEYDGEAKTQTDFRLKNDTPLLAGHTIGVGSPYLCTSVTDAGTFDNTLDLVITSGGADVTYNYSIEQIKGKITVSPREISLVTQDAEFTYNGSAQSDDRDPTFASYSKTLVYGHSFRFESRTSITNVSESGRVDNECAVKVFNGYTDVTSNYSITFDRSRVGKLYMIKDALEFCGKGNEYDHFVYDGEEKRIADYEQSAEQQSKLALRNHKVVLDSCVSVTDHTDGVENVITVHIEYYNGERNDNYDISYGVHGKVYIDKRPVSVISASAEKEYDGTPLNKEEFIVDYRAVSMINAGLVRGHAATADFSGTITDAGVVNNLYDVASFRIKENGVDKTDNYDVDYFGEGTLTVTPRPVTVKTASNTDILFDGAEHFNVDYAVTGGKGFVLGHRLSAIDHTTVRFVKKSFGSVVATANEVTYEIVDGAGNKNSAYGNPLGNNYTLIVEYGELKINPRPVSIRSFDANKIYDGLALKNYDVEVTASFDQSREKVVYNSDNGTIDFYSGSEMTPHYAENIYFSNFAEPIEHVVDLDNTFDYAFENGPDNYSVTTSYGKLNIEKRAFDVVSYTDSKVYDATPLTCDGYRIRIINMAVGEIVYYNNDSDTTISYSSSYGDNTQYYTIDITGSQTAAGSSPNEFTFAVYADAYRSIDVSSNYSITKTVGLLTVEKRNVYVYPENIGTDGSLVYDGAPHTCENVVVEASSGSDGLVAGHYVDSFNTDLSVTDAGSDVCRVIADTVMINDALGSPVTQNYNVIVENEGGVIVVSPRPIKIKAKGANGADAIEYNGGYNMVHGAELAFDSPYGLVEGHSLKAECSASIKNVGTAVNAITVYDVVTTANVSVLINYAVDGDLGTDVVEVVPRKVTVLTATAVKPYDGTALSDTQYTVKTGSIIFGHKLSAVDNASVTDASSVINAVEYVVVDLQGRERDEGFLISDNYDLTVEYGTLTVEKRRIKIVSASVSKVYDGRGLSDSAYTVTIENDGNVLYDAESGEIIYYENSNLSGSAINTETLSVNVYSEHKNAGVYDNEFTYSIENSLGFETTLNYEVDKVYGKLTVEKRLISVTSRDFSGEYDGKTHVEHGYDLFVDNSDGADIYYESGLGAEIVYYGAITDELVVTFDDASFVRYYSETAKQNVFTCELYNGPERVTDNYGITRSFGSLGLYKRAIEITTEDHEFPFNGEYNRYCTDGAYFVSGGSLALSDNGEPDALKVNALSSASIRNVGEAIENDIDFYIVNDEFIDVTFCYDITEVNGLLTVRPRPVTVKAKDATKVYDGTPLYATEVEIVDSGDPDEGLLSGHYAFAEFNGSQTDANEGGELAEAFVVDGSVVILSVSATYSYADETGNYEITVSDQAGYLTVTRRPILIKLTDTSKFYDGTPLAKGGYEVVFYPNGEQVFGEIGLIYGHEVTFETTPAPTEAEELRTFVDVIDNSWNVFDEDSGESVLYNYDVYSQGAWYSVNKRALSVTLHDIIKTYDGTPLDYSFASLQYGISDIYSVTVGVEEDKETVIVTRTVGEAYDFIIEYYSLGATLNNGAATPHNVEYIVITVTGEITDAGTVYNELSVRFFADEALTEEVTGCYDTSDSYAGTLTVKPRPVVITTAGNADDHFIYNGYDRYLRSFVVEEETPLVEGHYLVVSDEAWVSVKHVKDSGTLNRFSLSGYTVFDADGETVQASNYLLSFSSDCGKLYVDQKDLTIYTDSATFVYDGNVHYDFGFEAEGLVEGEGILQSVNPIRSGYTRVTFVDDGVKENYFPVAIKDETSGETITDDYEITYVYGTIEVVPRKVRLKPEDVTVEYSGKVFAPTAVEAIAGTEEIDDNIIEYFDVVEGDEIVALFVGSARYVKDSPVITYISEIVSVTRGDKDVSSCYEIYDDYTGVIEILPKKATITTASARKYYDGAPLVCHEYLVDGLVEGDVIFGLEFDVYATVTDVGSVVNAVDENSLVIVDNSGEEVTDCYEVSFDLGSLLVEMRGLKISAESAEKVYDGTPLVCADFTVVVDYDEDKEFVEVVKEDGNAYAKHYDYLICYYSDETRADFIKIQYLSVEIEGSLTNVGTSINTVANVSVFDSTGDVTDRFALRKIDGTLRVTERKVYIAIDGYNFGEYDGGEHYYASEPVVVTEKDGYPLADAYDFVDGHVFTASGWKKIRYVGETENSFEYKRVVDELGADVTDNYSIECVESGLLVIEKRVVEIETCSFDGGNIEYDGAEHTQTNYYTLSGSFVAGETVNVIGTAVRSANGEGVNNVLSFNIVSFATGARVDVTNCYEIKTLSYGTLIVVPRAITVKALGEEFVYDGTEHYLTSGSADRLVFGDKVSLKSEVSRKEWGVTEDVFPDEDSVVITSADGSVVTDNYAVSFSSEGAYINVVKRVVIITPESGVWEYDGEEHFIHEANASSASPFPLADGQHVSPDVEYTGLIKVVGSVNNEFKYGKDSVVILDESGEDVTENYDIISIGVGKLTVTARRITVETASYDGVYDGLSHDGTAFNGGLGYRITSGTFVEEQTFVLEDGFVFASVKGYTPVPVSNGLSYRIYEGFEDVTANYAVTERFGTLNVRKREITVESYGGGWTYDGLSHDGSAFNGGLGFAISEGTVAEGESAYLPEQELASVRFVGDGRKLNEIHIDITDGSASVVENYDITYDYGYLYIVARDLELRTGTWEDFYYNGKDRSYPYFEEGFDPDLAGLAEGDTLTVDPDGWAKIRNVGTIDNVVSVTINSAYGSVTDNYDITYTGRLTVRPLTVTIAVDGGSFVYDGDSHTVKTFSWYDSPENNALAEGQRFDFSATEALVFVTDVTAGVTNDVNVLIRDESGEDVTFNYVILKIAGEYDGKLSITPRDIAVKPVDKEKVYDGIPLVCTEGETTGLTSLAKPDHYIVVETVGERTDVGVGYSHIKQYSAEHPTVRIYDERGADISANYNVVDCSEAGELLVTQRKLNVQPASASYVFDGAPHTSDTLIDVSYGIDSGLIGGHTLVDYEIEGYATYVSDGYVPTTLRKVGDEYVLSIIDGSGNDVTGNYQITDSEGWVSVTPRNIYVWTANASKVYDGTPLTATDNYSLSVEDYDDVYVVANGADYIIGYYNSEAVHALSVTVTGSATNVFDTYSHNNTCSIYVYDEVLGDVTENYYVYKGYLGTLTITPRSVDVVWYGGDLGEYDGAPHTLEIADYERAGDETQSGVVDGYSVEFYGWETVTYANDAKPESDRVKNGAAIAVYKDGSYGVDYSVDYSENYNFNYGYDEEFGGVLTLSRRKLTIATSPDAEASTVVYDGEMHFDRSYAVVEGSVVSGERLSILSYGRWIDANEEGYDNALTFAVYTISYPNASRTDNYDITVVPGKFYVMRREVDLDAESATYYYDGLSHTSLGATVSATSPYGIVDGHVVYATIEGEQTDVGYNDSVIIDENEPIHFFDESGEDVSANYKVRDLNVSSATVTVLPRPVTVIAGSAEKEYDGEALYCDEYELYSFLGDALVEGHYAVVTVEGSVVDYSADGAKNVVSSVSIYSDDVDVTANYSITTEEGRLYITRRRVKVVTESAEKTYDALPLTSENAELVYIGKTPSASALVSGHEAAFTNFRSAVNVMDSGYNYVTVTVTDALGEDVTFDYEFVTDYGRLTVSPVSVIYSTPSAENAFIYNGEYQGVDGSEITILSGGLLYGVNGAYHVFTDDSFRTEINVGTYDNEYYFDVVDDGGVSVKSNYSFTAMNGTFTISPKRIRIATEGDEMIYDGNTHYYRDYFFLDENGDIVSAEEAIPSTDRVTSTSSFSVINATDEVGVENAVRILVIRNEYQPRYNSISNYEIEYVYGRIVVEKREIRLKLSDVVVEYDGVSHFAETGESVDENAEEGFGLVNGHKVYVRSYQEYFDVCENAPLTADLSTLTISDKLGNDVTDNYSIVNYSGYKRVGDGNMTIYKRSITIQPVLFESVYNGITVNAPNDVEIVSEKGLADGDGIEASVSGSGLFAGTYTSSIVSVAIYGYADGEKRNVTANYDVTAFDGEIIIYPVKIVYASGSAVKPYDGEPLVCEEGFEILSGEIVAGDIPQYIFTERTEIGTEANYVSVIVENAFGEDVTACYSFVADEWLVGYLTVTPPESKTITYYLYEIEETYDGTEYEVVIAGRETLPEDVSEVVISNFDIFRLTKVGRITCAMIEESCEYVVYDGNGDVTDEYYLRFVTTTGGDPLVIKPILLEIAAVSTEKNYDGEPLVCSDFFIATGELADGDEIDKDAIIFDGYQTNVGEGECIVIKDSVRITNASNEDVTLCYEIVCIKGTLKVK